MINEVYIFSPYDTVKVTRDIPSSIIFIQMKFFLRLMHFMEMHIPLKKKCNYSKDYRLKFAVQHGIYFGKEFFLPELNRFSQMFWFGESKPKKKS